MKKHRSQPLETARSDEPSAKRPFRLRALAVMLRMVVCCAIATLPDVAAAQPKVVGLVPVQAEPAKEAPAAKRRVVVAAPAPKAVVLQAQNEGMIQQWLVQLRPVMLAELNHIRQVCELTPEQRPAIRTAGETSLREAAEQYAKYQQSGRVVRGQLQTQPSPRTIIRQGLAKAVEGTLSAEQFARYTAEAKARSEQRKRATILGVVARLDGTLSLSLEQRDEIADVLSSRWRDDWEQWLMVSRYGSQYFPQIPNDVLVPQLYSAQRTVWSGVQKINVGFQNSFVQPLDDEAWWGGQRSDEVGPPEPIDQPVDGEITFGKALVKTLTIWFGGAK